MNTTSRTGLVPAKKRNFSTREKHKKTNDELPLKFEAMPMPLNLRPFGGIYNPFAKGCSLLCNHPAPSDLKDIISQMKSSLTIDAKNAQLSAKDKKSNAITINEHDNIPEDLFRRYTDTDSRPLTPTPTVTSIHTRNSTSSFLNARRCITPELGKNEIIKRKKIILDLRRTHSQETLYWKPSSDISQSITENGGVKSKSAGANEERKSNQQQRPSTSLGGTAAARLGGDAGKELEGVEMKKVQTCINDQPIDDEDTRCGRKRKKVKPPVTAPTPTTFHVSNEPETQIAALGPDSINPSARPSLIPNAGSLLPGKEKRESEEVFLLKGSFLTNEAFQALKTELDVDRIENTFDRYLNRALREAYKYLPDDKPKEDNKKLAETPQPEFVFKSQAKLPRKLTRSATRFDVPLDPKLLEDMTVLDYLSEYVWISDQRKQIFKRVFLQYLPNVEEQVPTAIEDSVSPITGNENAEEERTMQHVALKEYVERKIHMACLPQALEDVLEFYGTEKNISEVLRLLDFNEKEKSSSNMNFRTWCGIVAFAERLALRDAASSDSCDELEKVDFYSLELRLNKFKVPTHLLEVFRIIRATHHTYKELKSLQNMIF